MKVKHWYLQNKNVQGVFSDQVMTAHRLTRCHKIGL